MSYYNLSDKQWDRLKPYIPVEGSPKGGRPPKDTRTFINAIVWMLRTGSPWRALPTEFGSWNSVYSRFRRWEQRGFFAAIFKVLTLEADLETIMIDGSYIHAHKHAAGAKGGKKNKLLGVAEAVLQANCTH